MATDTGEAQISELDEAASIDNDDLFVLQHNTEAKKLAGSTLASFINRKAISSLTINSIEPTTTPSGTWTSGGAITLNVNRGDGVASINWVRNSAGTSTAGNAGTTDYYKITTNRGTVIDQEIAVYNGEDGEGAPSSDIPLADSGTGSAGASTTLTYSRSDHVHPTDTTRASATDLTTHTSNSTVHITASERTAWNAKVDSSTATVTIASGDWSSTTCTKTVSGVTASNNIIVTPNSASYETAAKFMVRASGQAANSITFTAKKTPTASITMNVLILD